MYVHLHRYRHNNTFNIVMESYGHVGHVRFVHFKKISKQTEVRAKSKGRISKYLLIFYFRARDT